MAYEDVKKYFRSEAHYNKRCEQMGVDGISDAMCLYERGDKCSHPDNKDGDCRWSNCPKNAAESEGVMERISCEQNICQYNEKGKCSAVGIELYVDDYGNAVCRTEYSEQEDES